MAQLIYGIWCDDRWLRDFRGVIFYTDYIGLACATLTQARLVTADSATWEIKVIGEDGSPQPLAKE